MSDLIVREDAIKALRLEYPMMPLFKAMREEWALRSEGFRRAEAVIMKLPSVDTPTTATGVIDAIREAEYRGYMKAVEDRPKRGKWIEVTNGRGDHECSECHDYAPSYQSGAEHLSHFCPNCGADMRGERADEHGRNKSADRQ